MSHRRMVDPRPSLLALAFLGGVLWAGCSDLGDPPSQPGPDPDPDPTSDVLLDALVPARTYTLGTVTLQGSGFGDGSGSVLFTSSTGTPVMAATSSWSDTEITATVPATAASGPVVVEVDGSESDPLAFSLAPEVSLRDDVRPIFTRQGCVSCHGGSGGFFVDSQATILAGGVGGPGVVPGNSAGSNLILRLLADPPDRMPQGAVQPIPAAEILVISDWIDQGARDN